MTAWIGSFSRAGWVDLAVAPRPGFVYPRFTAKSIHKEQPLMAFSAALFLLALFGVLFALMEAGER